MEVYIVKSIANRHDSSYDDIVDVFDSHEKAMTCIATSAEDFIKACDGGEPEGFKNYRVEEDFNLKAVIDADNDDFYEAWRCELYEVK